MIKRLLTYTAGPFLIIYLLLLLGSSYISQQNLRQATSDTLRFDLEKKAAILSYFHSERKHDLTTLAKDQNLNSFFSNRNLGMSMEDGLQVSLLSMQQSFQRMAQEKLLNQAPIYSRLLFIDNRDNILVDVGAPSGTPVLWSDTGLPESDQAATFVFLDGQHIYAILICPYFYKKEKMGAIVAEMNHDEVIHYLIHAQASENTQYSIRIADSVYIINHESSKDIQTTVNQPDNNATSFIAMPIIGTPFILAAHTSHKDALDTFLTSRWYLFSLVILSLLALYTIVVRSRAQIQALLLQRQVEEADRQNTLILEKNTLLKEEIQKRLNSETRLQTLVETIPDLIWLKDPEGNYLSCNPKFERLYGATEKEIIGRTDYDFVDRERADFSRKHDDEAMNSDKPLINEETVHYADDEHRESLEVIRTPLRDSEGKLIGVLGIARDITTRKQAEEEARYLSCHDPLTGLFNRRVLEARITEEIDRAERYQHTLSIFMVDLDHFKMVNDTYGHQSGDTVLCHLAKILAVSIRKTDYVARYGGEEFIVVLPETPLTEALELAERLCEEIREYPFLLKDNQTIHITASIGVACYPEHHKSWEGLIGVADSAMYAAKQAGRDQVMTA